MSSSSSPSPPTSRAITPIIDSITGTIYASTRKPTDLILCHDGSYRKPIVIWVDGCFDMMHNGHANALRQAKQMGDILVVGVHSDMDIELHKGCTVMKEQERYKAVAACKWVDIVVPNAPYFTQLNWLDQYHCDFCVHGDDITTLADGTDCYQEVKLANRYKECKRTPGISTTELVGRMLLMTKDHHKRNNNNNNNNNTIVPSDPITPLHFKSDELHGFSTGASKSSYNTTISQFLSTSRRIQQFSEGREPTHNDIVVYIDGDWDLFHIGHIELLQKARQLGTYLLVGVHDDPTVNNVKGSNYPLMNVHERVLSVLACRYVDEVIIGAPYTVSEEVLDKVYPVQIVVVNKDELATDGTDPYNLPRSRGILRDIPERKHMLTTNDIIDRIIIQRKHYEDRQQRKLAKETDIQTNLHDYQLGDTHK